MGSCSCKPVASCSLAGEEFDYEGALEIQRAATSPRRKIVQITGVQWSNYYIMLQVRGVDGYAWYFDGFLFGRLVCRGWVGQNPRALFSFCF